MPKINRIDCKTKGKIKAYTVAPSMLSKSFLSNNILVFEDLNIIQISINKMDLRWDN